MIIVTDSSTLCIPPLLRCYHAWGRCNSDNPERLSDLSQIFVIPFPLKTCKSQQVVGFEQFIIADILKIESVDLVLTISSNIEQV